MLQMGTPRVTVNQYIIEEYQDEEADEVVHHVVHESLERRRCVSSAEWHNQELKVVVMSLKRRLRDVIFMMSSSW
jgi:hypothetical protein